VNTKSELIQLPVEQLSRGKYQPRRDFDSESLGELAESIKSSGLIQPIVVRKLSTGNFEIVAGERRWRAAQMAGLDQVPCIVNNYTDEETAAITLIENLQRKDLNPIEEAQSLQRLMDEFGYVHEEVAAVVGKSRTKVSNTLRLLRLDEKVQQWLVGRQLSEGHGKILAGVAENIQFEIAEQCVAKGWSVRKLEEEAKRWQAQAHTHNTGEDPNITHLERAVSQQFGAPVKLDPDGNQKSGWIKIRYFDHDTLAGVLEKLGVVEED